MLRPAMTTMFTPCAKPSCRTGAALQGTAAAPDVRLLSRRDRGAVAAMCSSVGIATERQLLHERLRPDLPRGVPLVYCKVCAAVGASRWLLRTEIAAHAREVRGAR